MTTTYHTAIATGAVANASTFNTPLGALDSALVGQAATITALQDSVILGGAAVTLANGTAAAAQKIVTVDSSAQFVDGCYVEYLLAGATIERNVVDTVDSGTQITLTTNIGTGGIDDNTVIAVIPQGFYNASVGIYNVLDYGADNTGATDSSAAIQAAIDATSYGGMVYLPEGEYLIATTLDVPNGQAIRLAGSGAETVLSGGTHRRQGTRLKWGGANSSVMLTFTDNWYSVVEGVGFWANSATGMTAIEVDGSDPYVTQVMVRDCTFRDFAIGIHMGVTDPESINQCSIERCSFIGDYIEGIRMSSSNAYDIWIRQCTFFGNETTTTSDIHCVKGHFSVSDCSFSKQAAGGDASIYIESGRAVITGCYSEGENIPFLKWDAAHDSTGIVSIIGCDLRLSNLTDDVAIETGATGQLNIISTYTNGKIKVTSANAHVMIINSRYQGTLGGNDDVIEVYGYRSGGYSTGVIGCAGTGRAEIQGTAPLLALYDLDDSNYRVVMENVSGVLQWYRPGISTGLKYNAVTNLLDLHSSSVKLAVSSASATTLGNVTKKFAIYDNGGNLLGYVPIYDAIT